MSSKDFLKEIVSKKKESVLSLSAMLPVEELKAKIQTAAPARPLMVS
mgnify:CR=1 FL=1